MQFLPCATFQVDILSLPPRTAPLLDKPFCNALTQLFVPSPDAEEIDIVSRPDTAVTLQRSQGFRIDESGGATYLAELQPRLQQLASRRGRPTTRL